MVSVRDHLHRKRKKRIQNEPLPPGEVESQRGETDAHDGGYIASEAPGQSEQTEIVNEDFELEENTDPTRQRIKNPPTKWQRRARLLANTFVNLYRWVKKQILFVWSKRWWRELTPEEEALKREREELADLKKTLKTETKIFEQRIVNALNRRGCCYRWKKHEEDFFKSGIQEVRFDKVVGQREAIYFRVDTLRLPREVGILKLTDPDILTDLSYACRHRVRSQFDEKTGCWYIVERALGVGGIPRHVKYDEMIERMPASADNLTYPLGRGKNSKPHYRSLRDAPHILVAGATDTGKSNQVNVILSSIITRSTPDQMQMLMIDLKGGMEFSFYEGLPHLIKIDGVTETGIIEKRDHVPAAMQWLIDEGERRMEMIKKAGHKNISGYNKRRRKNRLSRIVFVIDEWADITLDRKIGNDANDKLKNIAGRMRAVGIHVILATQSPKVQVVSTIVKTNLPVKMAFSVPSNTASILIIDKGDAKDLEPKGRYVYQGRGDFLEVQAPFMSDRQIRQIIQDAIDGKTRRAPTRGHDVTSAELVRYAVHHLGGKLTGDDLFSEFQGRISFQRFSILAQVNGRRRYRGRWEVLRGDPAARLDREERRAKKQWQYGTPRRKRAKNEE